MENCTPVSSHRNSGERGNVLFLILIAVALFAALSYAVTMSSRSGGSDANSEKADLLGAQFSQFGAQLTNAVMRVRISYGCSETELNFENPTMAHPDYWGGSTNTSSPADGRCNIFSANGGGAAYWDARKQLPNSGWGYWSFNTNVGVEGVGTPEAELMLVLVMDSSDQAKRICSMYNKRMGITGETGSGTTRTLDWETARGAGLVYATAPTGGMQIGEDGGSPSAFVGQTTGCLTGASSHDGDSQILYYVLNAR